eukprot:scaffold70405_cov69-Phaeocystis_antarctica.AAC.7
MVAAGRATAAAAKARAEAATARVAVARAVAAREVARRAADAAARRAGSTTRLAHTARGRQRPRWCTRVPLPDRQHQVSGSPQSPSQLHRRVVPRIRTVYHTARRAARAAESGEAAHASRGGSNAGVAHGGADDARRAFVAIRALGARAGGWRAVVAEAGAVAEPVSREEEAPVSVLIADVSAEAGGVHVEALYGGHGTLVLVGVARRGDKGEVQRPVDGEALAPELQPQRRVEEGALVHCDADQAVGLGRAVALRRWKRWRGGRERQRRGWRRQGRGLRVWRRQRRRRWRRRRHGR